MTAIKQIQEIIVDVGEERTEMAQAQYGKAVRAVYTQVSGRPAHVGTCILVRTPEPVILTAAHVVDDTHCTGTYVAGANNLIETPGTWMATKAPDTGRRDDAFDFAIMRLGQKIVEGLVAEDFISIDDFEQTAVSPEGLAYCCLGYPRSKNKKIKLGNSIPTYCYRYWSTSAGCTNPRPGHFSNDTHLLVKFDKRRVGTADGRHVNPPDLHGMSGGLLVTLFNARDLTALAMGKPAGKVAGLNIEYHENKHAIVALRSHVIYQTITSCGKDSRG